MTLLAALGPHLAQPCRSDRELDALRDRPRRDGGGTGDAGIDDTGALLVRTAGGELLKLDAGEVHPGG